MILLTNFISYYLSPLPDFVSRRIPESIPQRWVHWICRMLWHIIVCLKSIATLKKYKIYNDQDAINTHWKSCVVSRRFKRDPHIPRRTDGAFEHGLSGWYHLNFTWMDPVIGTDDLLRSSPERKWLWVRIPYSWFLQSHLWRTISCRRKNIILTVV